MSQTVAYGFASEAENIYIEILFEINLTFTHLGPYSETWYKAIPAVLLGSISRENPKVSVLRLFRIQR